MTLRLTEHFTYDELTATERIDLLPLNREKGTGFLLNLTQLAGELEKVRGFFHAPVRVFSAFRCDELNAAIRGAAASDHLTGRAADFTVHGSGDIAGLRFVFEWCQRNTNYRQLILERPEGHTPWIHLAIPYPGEGNRGAVLEFDGDKYVNV